jgi:transcriptional regulator with XRE-family HTH domain
MVESRTWGKYLQNLREARKLTQQQVAKGIGASRERVNQWESESRNLKAEQVIKFANFFGVSCDEVLRGVTAENSVLHAQAGLSNRAIDRLKRWNTLKNNSSQSPGEYAREKTILRFINQMICSSHIYEFAEEAHEFQLYLGECIESLSNRNKILKSYLDNPDCVSIEIVREPRDDVYMQLDIDTVLLCDYRAKELFSYFMERLAGEGLSKHKMWELQREYKNLCERVDDVDGTH